MKEEKEKSKESKVLSFMMVVSVIGMWFFIVGGFVQLIVGVSVPIRSWLLLEFCFIFVFLAIIAVGVTYLIYKELKEDNRGEKNE